MRLVLPFLALPLGAAAGAGIAIFTGAAPVEDACSENCAQPVTDVGSLDYVKLSNQFVVPVVREERVSSLVVLSLSLEAASDAREDIFAKEPKLRDVFLQVLFDHAYKGGFDGAFTEAGRLELLRSNLADAAKTVVGSEINDVLITEIVRQEVG